MIDISFVFVHYRSQTKKIMPIGCLLKVSYYIYIIIRMLVSITIYNDVILFWCL